MSESQNPEAEPTQEKAAGQLHATRLLPRWALWVVGFLVALFLLPFVSPLISVPRWDEFILAYDSQRLLNGQVPYRDFFNFIPPGSFYALAGLFWALGGATLTAARYASLALVLVNWALLQATFERAGWYRTQALALSLIYPVALYPFWPVFSHHWLAHVCCFGFLLTAARLPRMWTVARCAALGLLTGLAGMVLQTEGLYLALMGGAMILLHFRGAACTQRLAAFATATVGAILLWLGPLLALGGGRAFLKDVLIWPARNYSQPGSDNARQLLEDLPTRLHALWTGGGQPSEGWPHVLVIASGSLLYGALTVAAGTLPALVFWTLATSIRKGRVLRPWSLASSLVTALALGLFFRGRPNWLWLLYLLGFVGPLWLVAWCSGQPSAKVGWRRMVIVVAWCVVAAAAMFHGRWAWTHWPRAWELVDADRPTRESPANRFLRSPGKLKPGETLAVFPEGGEVYLYSARPALGYTFFTPLSEGYNDLEDHERAAAEIEANQARWIIMTRDLEPEYLDPASPVARTIGREFVRRGGIDQAVFYERVLDSGK